MPRKIVLFAALTAALGFHATTVLAQEHGHEQPHPESQKWTFSGPMGHFDRAQLQRGFKIFREVCSNCHGLTKVAFRTLSQPGGPEFSPAQVAALAAEYKVKDGPNDAGDMFERPGRAADTIPWSFANEQQAASANGGKAPPDLSVMAKARGWERGFPLFIVDAIIPYQEQGPDYIAALLNGYKDDAPQGVKVPEGAYYNEYYPGNVIAMPKPLIDGQIEYPKGPDGKAPVPETVQQYGRDVAAFLMWAAEPHLEARKRMGFQVIIFLIALAVLMGYTKKRIWARIGGEAEGAPGTAPLGPTG